MKRYILITVGLLLAVAMAYAAITKYTYRNEPLSKSLSAHLDTSATMSLRYVNTANLLTSAAGTDSITIYIAVDGLWADVWDLGVVYDTLMKAGTTGSLVSSINLRYSGGETFKYETFRVRNSITTKADSSSPMKYNQIVIGR